MISLLSIANFAVGILVLILVFASILRLKSIKHMLVISLSFAVVAIIYVTHGLSDVYELGETFDAVSALITAAAILLTITLLNQKHSIGFDVK